ncbi:L,D-transpeptidase family protein [Croceicoccus sediminis]|uniref:L,D-transpeptidase family protein n=1 Tax=Croceicoccus sediminis TaxID=2571150 RepID=UPI001F103F95|nr:L,D-transpeptidase [Croceicoccus sediminis]
MLALSTALTFSATPLFAQDSASGSSPKVEASASTTSQYGFTLPDGVTQSMLGDRTIDALAVQVLLDRSVHSPGVIDGYGGGNTDRAIAAYRRANGLGEGGVDQDLIDSLKSKEGSAIFATYTVTDEDAATDFVTIPSDFAERAKLSASGYEDAREMLAERFHMDADFLSALNPDADFGKAGQTLTIVNHGDEKLNANVARIEIHKDTNELAVFNDKDELVATYPASIGSTSFPSPEGEMEVRAVAPAPKYYFNPEANDWGPDEQLTIAAGPNNPVGGTWIDLTKDGYGIHGSPDPSLIGKTNSHGCVRLTNWDAHELAEAVSQGVKVAFR